MFFSNNTLKRALFFGAGAMILVGLGYFYRTKNIPEKRLPELLHYRQLPAEFNAVLADRHREAEAPRSNSSSVRSLARLYQANRLDHEAYGCYEWLANEGQGLTAQDHYLLAEIALNEGSLPQAKAELNATLRSEPNYQPARLRFAAVLSKSGDEEEAKKEYELVIAREANQPEASIALARLDLQSDNDIAAIDRLERVLSAHPETVSAAALLAQILNRRGETARAAALTEWSQIRAAPASPDPWLDALFDDCYDPQRLSLRAEEMVNVGQLNEVASLLLKIERIDPDNAHVHLLKGWVADRSGKKSEAVEEYQRALDHTADPERVTALLAACLDGLGRHEEAIKTLDAGLKRIPGSTKLLTIQANLLFQQGDYSRARILLGKLLETAPHLYEANMTLANILWSNGERDDALVLLDRVAADYPADVASRGLLGQYYFDKGNPIAACKPLEEAIHQSKAGSASTEKLNAMFIVACLRAGTLKASGEQWLEAASYFEKAGRLSPNGQEALAQLAAELKQKRDFKTAAEVLKRLATIQPDNPTIELSVGDLLYQGGDTSSAQTHWQRALALASQTDVPLREAISSRLKGEISVGLFD